MNKKNKYIKWLFALALVFPLAGHCATIYTVDIDASNSSVTVDGTETYSILGSFNITIDNSNLSFTNLDTITQPTNIASELFFTNAIATYDGLNFEYRSDPPESPVIANIYTGAFDGNVLNLSGQTQGSAFFDFNIQANVVSSVPLPGALVLFLSGFIGLVGFFSKKSPNKSLN